MDKYGAQEERDHVSSCDKAAAGMLNLGIGVWLGLEILCQVGDGFTGFLRPESTCLDLL